jgi:hypothetical protein
MSTILDAIQKAEKQRKSDVVPSLETIVSEKRKTRKRRSGGWILTVIGFLLVAALAVLGYQNRAQVNTMWDQAASKGRQVIDRVGGMVKDMVPGQQATVEPGEAKVAVAAPAVSEEEELTAIDKQAEPDDQVASSDQVESAAPEPGIVLSQLQRDQLNQIELSVISYSKNKDKRFVMVGSKVLREGDVLKDFPIVRIKADGVVVDVQGQAVLIRP